MSHTENVSCPDVASSGTPSALAITSGSPVGSFTVTYEYHYNGGSTASGSFDFVIVNDDIPVVNVKLSLANSLSQK